MSAATYRTLNAFYMRGLRRIAGDCRFSSAVEYSDLEIRRKLGMPSLSCVLSQRRIGLVLKLVRFGVPALCSLLAHRHKGVPLKWTALVLSDLQELRKYHAPKLDSLGDPGDPACACAWARFMAEWPRQFSMLVRQFKVFQIPPGPSPC